MSSDDEAEELLAAAETGRTRKPAAAGKRARVVSRLLSFAAEDRLLLFGAAFFVVVSSALDSLTPYYAGACLSSVVDQDAAGFGAALRGLVAVSLAAALCAGARVFGSALVEVRLVERLRARLLASLLRQETAFFDARVSGELVSRLTSDVTVLSAALTTNGNLIGQSATNIATTGVVMFAFDPTLTAGFFAASLLFFAGTRWVGTVTRTMQQAVLDATASANGRATQAVSLLRTVRSLGGERLEAEAYASAVAAVRSLDERIKLVWALYIPSVSAINLALSVGVLAYGRRSVTGQPSAAAFTAFYLYTGRLQGALQGVAQNWAALMSGLGAGEAVFDLIDRQPLGSAAAPRPGAPPLLAPSGRAAGALAFSGVHFAYASRPAAPVLRGVSLEVPPGGRVALVGRSGNGKTTLLALALRLYDPSAGAVSLDGVDVRLLRPDYLRSAIGCVSQEPPLLALSLRDNVLYAAPPGSAARLPAALALAQLDAVVAGLEGGLDTLVGERGARLSGGQKQRVALARAVVRDPSLLLLDEATSALDGASEAAVTGALERHLAARKAGLLVVAHRLSTVRGAHTICVLQGGAVAERGTFDELVAARGLFHALLATQLQAIDDAAMGGGGEAAAAAGGGEADGGKA